jgi:hypothetical protein
MDPSQPTKPANKKFHFRQWKSPVSSTQPSVEIEVKNSTTLTAEFDVQQK